MSSLNKAFLKAYQKTGSKAQPAAPVAAPTANAPPIAGAAVAAPHFAAQPAVAVESAVTLATKLRVASATANPAASASSSLVVDTSPTAPLTTTPDSPAAVSVAPGSSSAAPTSASPAQPPATFAIVDMAHTPLKAPHAKFAPPAAAAAAAAGPAATVTTAPKAPTVEPPLLTRPPAPIVHSPAPTSTVWQPLFELSNFSWPEITDAILAAAPGQLQTAATDLAEACRRHRKLVAVTGVHGGEGCSVIAMTLARALAAQQQKVVLVDAHFAAPRLANCLGVAAEVGWEESLAGDRPLAEAVVQSIADHVALAPLKKPTPADWRLADIRLKSCFDELRRHFDVVLIDAGPMGEPSDKRQLLAWAAPCRVDRALVVLDGRSAIEEAIAEVDTRLQGCGIAQWSFVDNFAAA